MSTKTVWTGMKAMGCKEVENQELFHREEESNRVKLEKNMGST